MSEGVVVAVISAGAVVIVAVITTFGAKINGRLKRVQGQVENDHAQNLREELDQRHEETRAWFQYLRHRQDTTDDRIDRMLELVGQNRERIEEIEDTLNPKETKP